MKTRILAVTLVCAAAGILAWFFYPASPASAAKPAEAITLAKIEASKPAAPLSTPVAPKTASAQPQTAPTATAVDNPTGDPRGDPTSAVSEAARLLQIRDYADFVREFVPPDSLQNDLDRGMTVNQLVQEFEKGFNGDGKNPSQAHLLEVLQILQGRTPTLDAKGEQATFTLDPPVAGWGGVNLVKINGLWYFPYE